MKKIPQLLVFPLICLTVLLSVACSKRGAEENAALDQKLNSLKVDVDIKNFHQVLGEPSSEKQREVTNVTMTIKRHAPPKKVEEKFTYKDYLYENEHFYVQAVTDEAGKVGMFSITARDSDYLPTIQTEMDKPIQLGKTVYADFSPTARKIAADFRESSTKPSYYEVVVHTGKEQTYVVVATNPHGKAGKIGKLKPQDGDVLIKWFSLAGQDFPLNEEHDAFRKATVINTYTEVAPWFRGVDNSGDGANFGENTINFGPHTTQLKKNNKL